MTLNTAFSHMENLWKKRQHEGSQQPASKKVKRTHKSGVSRSQVMNPSKTIKQQKSQQELFQHEESETLLGDDVKLRERPPQYTVLPDNSNQHINDVLQNAQRLLESANDYQRESERYRRLAYEKREQWKQVRSNARELVRKSAQLLGKLEADIGWDVYEATGDSKAEIDD